MISVIVPIYNVEAYVSECIESIIHQTYRDLEIILVDDGSTDHSGMICDRYARCDSRIRVIHKPNGGLSDARNAGIEAVHGDFLGFVDGDDFIHKNMYQELYECLRTQNADIAACLFRKSDVYMKDWQYDRERETVIFDGTEALCHLEIVQVVAVNKLYHRKFFESLRYPVGRLHEDEAVIHRILYQCRCLAFTGKELYGYRIRDNSIMTSKLSRQRICDAVAALKDRVNFAYEMQWDKVQKAVLNRFGSYVRDYYFVLEKEKITDYKELQVMLKNELYRLTKGKKKI